MSLKLVRCQHFLKITFKKNQHNPRRCNWSIVGQDLEGTWCTSNQLHLTAFTGGINPILSNSLKHTAPSKIQRNKTELTVAEISGDIVSGVRNKGQGVQGWTWLELVRACRTCLELVHVQAAVKWGTSCTRVSPTQPGLSAKQKTKNKQTKQNKKTYPVLRPFLLLALAWPLKGTKGK